MRGRVMLTMYRGEIVFRREGFGVADSMPAASRLEGLLENDDEG
jgi:hypothetical protein